SGDPDRSQQPEQAVRDGVVDGALTLDGAALLSVERRGVILVLDQQQIRIVGAVDPFGLALVQHLGALMAHSRDDTCRGPAGAHVAKCNAPSAASAARARSAGR